MKKTQLKINKQSGFTPSEVLKETFDAEKIKEKLQTGFTLIEVLVYLVLFAILMTGSVAAAYSLFESSDRNQTKVTVQEEGDFLLAKISWALSGVQAVNSPPIGGSGSMLSVNKWDSATGAVVVYLNGSDLYFSQGGNPALPLNNSGTAVKNLVFTHNFGGGVNPESVRASFEIDATTPNGMTVTQEFSTTKFIRK